MARTTDSISRNTLVSSGYPDATVQVDFTSPFGSPNPKAITRGLERSNKVLAQCWRKLTSIQLKPANGSTPSRQCRNARAPSDGHDGDLIFFQGHSAPGIYARAYLEGRISEAQLRSFRQETGGKGLAS